MALLYLTCKNKNEAERISAHLLKKRLIACASIFPVKSMYRWDHKIVNENEEVIIAKTSSKNFKKAVIEIKKIHSYKIPCILRIDAAANRDYGKWANNEMK